jgi:rod shape-determining protein MreD
MAKRSGYFWLFIALLVIVHFMLRVGFGLGSPSPDFLTVAALLGARRLRASLAAILGFGLGLLQDGLALAAFGTSTFALTVVSFLGARTRDFFEGDSFLFLGFYLFIGKWIRDAIVFGLTVRTARVDATGALLVEAPIEALVTAVAGAVAFLIYRGISGEK